MLSDVFGQTLMQEMRQGYRHVFDALIALEKEYPVVTRNQNNLGDPVDNVMVSVHANLLYALQAGLPEDKMKSRREIRDAILELREIPTFMSLLVALAITQFCATIYMAEHLFFLNRELGRRVQEDPKPKFLENYTYEQVVYPMERVDEIVQMAYETWKEQHVLQDPG